jgi:hypothetical protein
VEINCKVDHPAGYFDDDHGQLVVTGVFNEGFFVTDVSDQTGEYNHLYAYSYSYPQDLELGDRLDRLAGLTQDFSGCTQISFPIWHRAVDADLNPEPFQVTDLDALIPPVTVDTDTCLGGSDYMPHLCGQSSRNWELEALESARVRLENLRAPDIYINCDFNGDQEVDPEWMCRDGSLEGCCQKSCLERNGSVEIIVRELIADEDTLQDVVVMEDEICPWESSIEGIQPNCVRILLGPGHVCSELATLRQYGQWSVAMDDGDGPLINLLTRESLVGFDPTKEEHLDMHIGFVQGNLRHVRAARPRWIVLVGHSPDDAPEVMK